MRNQNRIDPSLSPSAEKAARRRGRRKSPFSAATLAASLLAAWGILFAQPSFAQVVGTVSNVRVTPGDGSITFEWNYMANNDLTFGEFTAFGFCVVSESQPQPDLNSFSDNNCEAGGEDDDSVTSSLTRSYTFTGTDTDRLVNGTAYYAFMRARHSLAFDSVWAAPDPFVPIQVGTTPPAQPSDLVATAGDSSIALTWTWAQAGGAAADGFGMCAVRDIGTPPDFAAINTADCMGGERILMDVSSRTYTIDSLDNGTAYYVAVRARGAGTARDSDWSTVAGTATPIPPPAKPNNLLVTAGDESIMLTWTWAQAGGAAADGFEMCAVAGSTESFGASFNTSDCAGGVQTVGASTRTGTITGLMNGTAYRVAVRATGPARNSAWLTTQSTFTPTAPVSPPINVMAMPGSEEKKITVTWAFDGNVEMLSSSQVCAVEHGGATAPDSEGRGCILSFVPSPTATWDVTGLMNGIPYRVWVRVQDTNGVFSDWAGAGDAVMPAGICGGFSETVEGLCSLDNVDRSGSPSLLGRGVILGNVVWRDYGQVFTTNAGFEKGGYALSSIAIRVVAVAENPTGPIEVEIRNANETNLDEIVPGDTVLFDDFDPQTPSEAGIVRFTPNSAFPLNPIRRYAVVVHARATTGDGEYGIRLKGSGGATGWVSESAAVRSSDTNTGGSFMSIGSHLPIEIRAAVAPAGCGGFTAEVEGLCALNNADAPGDSSPLGRSSVDGNWHDYGQVFTAGSNVGGYTLSSIAIRVPEVAANPTGPIGVEILNADETNPDDIVPGDMILFDDFHPQTPGVAGAIVRFNPNSAFTLEPNSRYAVVVHARETTGDREYGILLKTTERTSGWARENAGSRASAANTGSGSFDPLETHLPIEIRAVALPPVPYPPTNVTAMAGDASIVVSWGNPDTSIGNTAPELFMACAVASSAAFPDDASTCVSTDSVTGDQRTATLTGLANGIVYKVAVRSTALGTAGAWIASTLGPVTPVAVAAPTGVSVAPGPRQSTVSWTAGVPEADERAATSFEVCAYRADRSPGGFDGAQCTGDRVREVTDASTTSLLFDGLDQEEHWFAVRGVDGADASAWVPVAEAVALPINVRAPSNVVATAATDGSGSITVNWGTPTSDSGNFDPGQYQTCAVLEAASFPSGGAITACAASADSGNGDTRTHTLTGLTVGTAYKVAVRPLGGNGELGAWTPSEGITVTPTAPPPMPPAPPTIGTVTAGDASIVVNWTAGTGTPAATGHSVCAILSSMMDFPADVASCAAHVAMVSVPTAVATLTTGLTNGMIYKIAVRSYHATAFSAWAEASGTFMPMVPPVPYPPTNVTAMAGDASIVVSWGDPDTSTGNTAPTLFTACAVESSAAFPDDSTTCVSTAEVTDDLRTATLTGLANGTEYEVAVRSIASGTAGAWTPSDGITVTPTAAGSDDSGLRLKLRVFLESALP